MKNEKILPAIFILPAFAGIVIFIIVPMIFSFSLSFFDWNLLSNPRFVGLNNYISLIKERDFWQVLLNTFVYSLSVTIFGVAIPLVLASALNCKIRGSGFFKTAYFLPFITPMVIIAIVWQWIFDPTFGLINNLFHLKINWLYDTKWAMSAIVIVSVWKLIGYNTIILLSGFASISNSLYESAKLDGAGSLQTFAKITLPLLSPVIFFVIIITVISSFQVFDLIFLMTQGGPLNSTNVLVYWLFQNAFEYFKEGKASAIAYVLFTIVFVLTIFQWKIRKFWVENE